jgi:hypothetical protein
MRILQLSAYAKYWIAMVISKNSCRYCNDAATRARDRFKHFNLITRVMGKILADDCIYHYAQVFPHISEKGFTLERKDTGSYGGSLTAKQVGKTRCGEVADGEGGRKARARGGPLAAAPQRRQPPGGGGGPLAAAPRRRRPLGGGRPSAAAAPQRQRPLAGFSTPLANGVHFEPW